MAGIVLARIYAPHPERRRALPFSAIAALAAAGDLRTILGRNRARVARLARHIWRMSLAMFVATASFFLGQQQHLPAQARGTFIPALPVLAVLGLMIVWLIRIRLNRAPKRAAGIAPLREATT